MLKIRKLEERIFKVYADSKMYGISLSPLFYMGEEAITVDVCQNLDKDDHMFSVCRCHGHCLAKDGRTKKY